jgi:hypothetical protein
MRTLRHGVWAESGAGVGGRRDGMWIDCNMEGRVAFVLRIGSPGAVEGP